jgi:cell division protein FtsL
LKVTSKCKSKKEHNIEKTEQMQKLARRKEIQREWRKLKMKKRTTQHYKVT